eukprot:scaffold305_cov247-Pinguiococcus_pyrenoidosus.AAC.4
MLRADPLKPVSPQQDIQNLSISVVHESKGIHRDHAVAVTLNYVGAVIWLNSDRHVRVGAGIRGLVAVLGTKQNIQNVGQGAVLRRLLRSSNRSRRAIGLILRLSGLPDDVSTNCLCHLLLRSLRASLEVVSQPEGVADFMHHDVGEPRLQDLLEGIASVVLEASLAG